MKKSAKILSIILALVMILSAIPMAAFAADSDFVINESGALTAYNGAGGDIVIPDSAVAIFGEAFSGNSTITSVTMPNVVSISSSAFMNCTNLESVIMPKVSFIDYYGFINCPNLESITVSDCIVAREGAFINCGSLTNVYCTCSSDVNLIKDALSSCGEYNYIKFEHNFVDGVCSVCGIEEFVINEYGVITAYNGAGGDVVIPAGPVSIGVQVFFCNDTITSVVIPEGIERIADATFGGCSNLVSVSFPDSLLSIADNAFSGCSSLKHITIPRAVTYIGETEFYGCTSLESVTMSDNVTTVGQWAFENCASLTTVFYPCSSDKNAIENLMKKFGDFTYTQLDHQFVAEYVDNNNGTHSQKCSECGQYLNPTNHTFVDDVCTLCGAEKAFKTIREILDTVPDFPTNEEDAWTNENGAKVYLTFEGIWHIVFPDMQSGVNNVVVKSGDNYYESYVPDTIYVMKDGVLDCIIVSRSVEGDLNGTYRPACKHTNAYTVTGKAATCTEDGLTDGEYCPDCETWVVPQEVIPALNHAAYTVTGKAATCTENGLTDGEYCPACDTWLVPQEVIPATNHANAYTVPEKAVTCTEDGHSAYLYCPDCDEALEVYDVYVALNHAYAEDVDGKAATCTEDGLTDGKYCPDCNTWLVKPEVIPALNHKNAYTVTGKAATCTENGLTDGEYCPDCETWIVPQEVIPATNHPNAYNENGEAETCSSSGVTPGVYCPDCDTYISGHETIDPHPHSITDEYIDNEDGTHSQFCEECGEPITVSEHTFVNGVCVCGAKKTVTILDVISTNKDFPTDIANAWLNEDGSTLIYKTDTNTILFATAAGDNTSNIGTDCTVDEDGDNYKFINDYIFNMEDGVLKSVTMIDQYSSLKGTYAPHTHAYTDSYVDNGDGTHTGSCACGAVNPEAEAHTFVDGVCVCGAKEPAEPNIKDVICDPSPDTSKVVHATVAADTVKIQLAGSTGNTFTYTRDNSKVSIQAYDADGNEVEAGSEDAAYEVWTINQTLKEDTYTAIAKDAKKGWDAQEDACTFEVVNSKSNIEIFYIVSEVVATKPNEKFGVNVLTGSDITKIAVQYNGHTYKTFTPSGKDAAGNNIFECYVASGVMGDNEITVQYKTADGWQDCSYAITVTIGDEIIEAR